MTNLLDQAVAALRQQLRALDADERAITQARHRIDRALAALNADPVSGVRRREQQQRGPGRLVATPSYRQQTMTRPATHAVREAVLGHFQPGQTFALEEVYPLVAYARTAVSEGLLALAEVDHCITRISPRHTRRAIYQVPETSSPGLEAVGDRRAS